MNKTQLLFLLLIAGSLAKELMTVIEVFNRGISNPEDYSLSAFEHLWTGNENNLNILGQEQFYALGKERARLYKNKRSAWSLWGEDAEDDNVQFRAIDDDACEPSARFFSKGFLDIFNDENTDVQLLEEDYILAAGNEGTCG